MMAALGIGLDKVTLDLILPVGISFYTFQALSYTIDVYRGKNCADTRCPGFFAYISFFSAACRRTDRTCHKSAAAIPRSAQV